MIRPKCRSQPSWQAVCRIALATGLSLFLIRGFHAVHAADPVAYKVIFIPSGDKELDGLLKQTSSLAALGKKLPAAPFALIGRAQADAAQFGIVLHSLGYDAGSVDIRIAGKALADPALLGALDAAPEKPPVEVVVRADKGPLYHVAKIVFSTLPPGFTLPDMIKPGDPARAQPILAVTPAMVSALHNAGYAFAQVGQPFAVANDPAKTLSVSYSVTPGPHVEIGPISFDGLTRTHEAFLRRHITLRQGQPYSDTALSGARDSLLGLGVFSSVTPVPAKTEAPPGQVPVTCQLTEQKRHAVTLGGAYATDTGFSVTASWEDRNLFRNAETLTVSASISGFGGSATPAPGYDLKTVFAKPDYYFRSQTLTVTAEALKQYLTAYDQTAFLTSAILSRPLTKHLNASYGLGFVTENIKQEGTSRDYVLLQVPLALTYDNTDSLFAPTKGFRANLSLTPTKPVAGGSGEYVILQATGSTYLAVEPDARGILALRALVGTIQGASQFQVPPDERFYAGGTGTVRGYSYQTIGPLFADDNPQGGLAIDAATIEFRQRVLKNVGIVPFVDAGQVSARSRPFAGSLSVGAGLGLRYYTGIGPIRVDFAVPLKRTAGSSSFAVYIGLGEAF
jgi:translocation and assembly module TamA